MRAQRFWSAITTGDYCLFVKGFTSILASAEFNEIRLGDYDIKFIL